MQKYLLLGVCYALTLLNPFLKQICTRGTLFSLQIDDHFNQAILNAEVISPSFLYTTNRTISSDNISNLASNFPWNLLSLAYKANKLFILESSGLIIFDIRNNFNPKILQHYRDKNFANYFAITVEDFIALNNFNTILVININELYPEIIIEYTSTEKIQVLGIINRQIVVCTHKGVQLLSIIDEELGIIEVKQTLEALVFGLDGVEFTGMYIGKSIFLLEKTLGLIELSYFPLRILKFYNIPGKTIAGYKDSILIDGNIEMNLGSLAIKTYNSSSDCKMIDIDEEFIYCVTETTLFIASRLITLSRIISYTDVKIIKSLKSVLLIGLKEYVFVQNIKLGPLYITGIVPDEVKDYTVEFRVNSLTDGLVETFLLSIQYSATSVIIFILLCFIGVFLMVFLSTMLCKYLSRESPAADNQNILDSDRPVIPTTERANLEIPTDRNIMSDRNLLSNTQRDVRETS